jgi:gamma-glutamyl hercynylcysteine S-oxide synthase
MDSDALIPLVEEARARTLDLLSDLSDDRLMVPQAPTLNPFNWEAGHVAHFWERFILRDLDGARPYRPDVDQLFDSARVAHETRWDLRLPPRDAILKYMQATLDAVVDRLHDRQLDRAAWYRNCLALFHEDMHTEAFTYMRQSVQYPPPPIRLPRVEQADAGSLEGDAEIPGGRLWLGTARDAPWFVFDNEQWEHAVELEHCRMSRAPVTQGEFARFVDDAGYLAQEFWSEEGWKWREQNQAEHPIYWRKEKGRWQRRHFDQWRALEPHRPVIHVCYFEAEAYCNWAYRRLPTEAEWEAAAACEPQGNSLSRRKWRLPWGDTLPGPSQANLDWSRMDTVDVAALPESDSAFGCRQMIGNVWEWTSSEFRPYPGFEVGPYKEYSEPWFYERKVLRGGAWCTRSRLVHNMWRNFFQPWRRDVPAGFRTCAL